MQLVPSPSCMPPGLAGRRVDARRAHFGLGRHRSAGTRSVRPPQTGKRRRQHEHPKPVRHSLREGVSCGHSRCHSLRRPMFPGFLDPTRIAPDRPPSAAVLKIARSNLYALAARCSDRPLRTASPASFGRCLWSTQQARSRRAAFDYGQAQEVGSAATADRQAATGTSSMM